MTLQVTNSEDAPGFAHHSSSFRNDDRCYEVDFIIGSNYDEVQQRTRMLYQRPDHEYSDYDVNYSTEGDMYVGITCRDYPGQESANSLRHDSTESKRSS